MLVADEETAAVEASDIVLPAIVPTGLAVVVASASVNVPPTVAETVEAAKVNATD